MQKQKLNVLVVLSSVASENKQQPDLQVAIVGTQTNVTLAENGLKSLQLEPLTQWNETISNDMLLRVYKQNVDMSRKKVLPVLQNAYNFPIYLVLPH